MDGKRLISSYTPASRFEADLLVVALHCEDVSQIVSEKAVEKE